MKKLMKLVVGARCLVLSALCIVLGAGTMSAAQSVGVQLWSGGPYFAECNVGATKPEESGYYFWWGDTVGYKRNGNSWDAVDGSETGYWFYASYFGSPCPTYDKPVDTLKLEGWIGDDDNLVAAHDAATAYLGSPWRMPTCAELEKLVDDGYCKWEWTNQCGVAGWRVTGVTPGYTDKSIFLPAVGYGGEGYLSNFGERCYYWSSTPDRWDKDRSICLETDYLIDYDIYYVKVDPYDGAARFEGFSVRPVRGADTYVEILPDVPYRTWNEVKRQMEDEVCTDYTVVKADTTTFEDGKWYVATGVVTCASYITVSGSANLILADGATLTANGTSNHAGVDVAPGNSLTIYGQKAGTGKLTATGGSDAAGIGGNSGSNCGDITIVGGTVTATGGQRAAGIGGGAQSKGKTGTIRIAGGYVVAKSASMGGSGIGSGRCFSSVGDTTPPVVISGGTVWASGSRYDITGQWGADLGRGLNNSGGSVTITGGSVLANRGYIAPAPTGNGQNVYCVTVDGLEANSPVNLAGLGDYGTNDISADANGKIYLYLPKGLHGFSVNGEEYGAVVANAAVNATKGGPKTNITVNGTDLGDLSGDGWQWSNESCAVVVSKGGDYVFSGEGAGFDVKVTKTVTGVTVLAENLALGTFDTAFTVKKGTSRFDSVGGTMTVLGGSISVKNGVLAKDGNGNPAYCVTVGGFEGSVIFEDLEDYGTDGIKADSSGKIYLWLPDGDYRFRVSDGVNSRRYGAKVNGMATTATEITTDFTINGVSIVEGMGDGWQLDGQTLMLARSAARYVLSGTVGENGDFGIKVEGDETVIVLSNATITASKGFDMGEGLNVQLLLAGVSYLTFNDKGITGRNGSLSIDSTEGGEDDALSVEGNSGDPLINMEDGEVLFKGGVVALVNKADDYDALVSADTVTFEGGTLHATADEGEYAVDAFSDVIVSGGSLYVNEESAGLAAEPIAKKDGDDVFPVVIDLPAGTPDRTPVTVEGLEPYGTKGLYPIGGKLYLYLPAGSYGFTVNGEPYVKIVDEGGEVTDGTGFLLNGVDIAVGEGDSWTAERDEDTGKWTVTFGNGNDYHIRGSLDGRIVVGSCGVNFFAEGLVTCDGITVNEESVLAIASGILEVSGAIDGEEGALLHLNDGTVVVNGGIAVASTEINGGSVKTSFSSTPKNKYEEPVYCVTVEGLGDSEGPVGLEGLEDYGTNDIYAVDGNIYLWLPNGRYEFSVNGLDYFAAVDNANTTAIRRIGEFSARFVETGNGVGKIIIDDYGHLSEKSFTDPIVDGKITSHYVNSATGVDTNLTFGVIYVDVADNVVILPTVDRENADPRYLANDRETFEPLEKYIPSDALIEGEAGNQTVTLSNYGSSFQVGGFNFYVGDDDEEVAEQQLADATEEVKKKHADDPDYERIFDLLGEAFGDVVKIAVNAVIVAVDAAVAKVKMTFDKIVATIEGIVSLILRSLSDLYVGEGLEDDDYYMADDAAEAFDRTRNKTSAVHFMRDVSTPSYTLDGSDRLNIDMAGSPRLDVSFAAVWAGWDLEDPDPVLQALVNGIVSEIAKLGIEALEGMVYQMEEGSYPHHTGAADEEGSWLTVTDNASITLANFKESDWTLKGPLATVRKDGRLTVNSSTISGFTVADNGVVCVYGTGHVTFSDSKVTGNRKSSGALANVFVDSGSCLSVKDDSCRIGVSGQTEGGDAFAQTDGESLAWSSVYSNDAHPGDSTYEIEVNDKNELCWKWNVPDPDAPSFPKPGDEGATGGKALNIRMITKEVEPGVVMSYARIWGAPTNAVKGAWYYLMETQDLKDGKFNYLPDFKWRATQDGVVTEMMQGPEESCCDVPAPPTITNWFFRIGVRMTELCK